MLKRKSTHQNEEHHSSLTPTHREYYRNKNSLISEGVKSFVFLWSKMWIE